MMSSFFHFQRTLNRLFNNCTFFKIDALKLRNTHKKALMLESLFNTIAGFQPCNYIKK